MEASANRALIAEGAEFAAVSRTLFGNIKQRFLDERDSHGRVVSTMLGNCRFSQIETSPLHVWVERVAPKSHDVDYIKLLLQVSGRTRFSQAGLVAHLTPGTWILFDPTRPYNLVNASLIEQVVVQLPRDVFPRRSMGLFERPHFFAADEEGLPRIVASMVATSVRQLAALEESERARVSEIIGQLAAANLAGENGADNTPLSLLRQRVKSHIEANLGNPALSMESIARSMGCSRRYLHRAFEDDDTTVERFLWDARLERSRRRLAAAECADMSISEIAFVCGFNSSAHFSRAFRARYGCAPREFRASPVTAGAPS
jgi:AraC-like DNA-binding protein